MRTEIQAFLDLVLRNAETNDASNARNDEHGTGRRPQAHCDHAEHLNGQLMVNRDLRRRTRSAQTGSASSGTNSVPRRTAMAAEAPNRHQRFAVHSN